MRISIIAAMGRNRVIGCSDARLGLPWHLPVDLQRFRRLTMGKPVILGRRTHELIGRPLPGRPNIVLTHNESLALSGCHRASGVASALEIARSFATDEVMVIGGAEVYTQFLTHTDRLYLTVVDAEPAGDAFFPAVPLEGWHRSHSEELPADDRHAFPHTFGVWERDPSK